MSASMMSRFRGDLECRGLLDDLPKVLPSPTLHLRDTFQDRPILFPWATLPGFLREGTGKQHQPIAGLLPGLDDPDVDVMRGGHVRAMEGHQPIAFTGTSQHVEEHRCRPRLSRLFDKPAFLLVHL